MKESKRDNLIKFNKDNILSAAKELFNTKGIEKTTMDDIAKKAEYSKSTVYVYFKSKDEIYNHIIYENMCYIKDIILKSINKNKTFEKQFYAICSSLVKFQKDNPVYFKSIINEIQVNVETIKTMSILKNIFDVGEEINHIILKAVERGIANKEICSEINALPTVFMIWGSICGIISMASEKEEYIKLVMKMTKKQFLDYSFHTLYKVFGN